MDAERFHHITVEIAGKRWSGDWQLIPGGKLCVGGAYGSRTVPVGRAKPENVAARTLTEMVQDWRAKRQ